MNSPPQEFSGFKFDCPHCSQSLEATPELIGESLHCPNCGKGIRVPAPPQMEVVAVKEAESLRTNRSNKNTPIKYLRPVLLLTAILALGFGVKIAINHHRNPQSAGTPKEIAGSKMAAFYNATELFSKKIETVKTPEDFANALNQYMDKFEPLVSSFTSDDATASKTEEQRELGEEIQNWSIKNAHAQDSLWIAVYNLSVKFNTSPKSVEAYSRVEEFNKKLESRTKKITD